MSGIPSGGLIQESRQGCCIVICASWSLLSFVDAIPMLGYTISASANPLKRVVGEVYSRLLHPQVGPALGPEPSIS